MQSGTRIIYKRVKPHPVLLGATVAHPFLTEATIPNINGRMTKNTRFHTI